MKWDTSQEKKEGIQYLNNNKLRDKGIKEIFFFNDLSANSLGKWFRICHSWFGLMKGLL